MSPRKHTEVPSDHDDDTKSARTGHRHRRIRRAIQGTLGLGTLIAISITGLMGASAGNNALDAKTHQGQLKSAGGVLMGYTNGNTNIYSELDKINFRFTLTATQAGTGQMQVRFTEDGNSCLFFDGTFTPGKHDNLGVVVEPVSGAVPTVTPVGAPTLDAPNDEYVQVLQVSFAAAGEAVYNYHLRLTGEAGECSGASQHSRLGNMPSSPTNDFGNIGTNNQAVPANQVIELPEITVNKQIDRDGNGSFESTAAAGEFCFTLDANPCQPTNASGQVVFSNVTPNGAHTITETQLNFSQGIYGFISGTGTNCTFSPTGTATATVSSGTTSTDATCTFNNRAAGATVTIIKDANFESGQPFGFAGSFGPFNLVDDGPPATNATAVFSVTTGFGSRNINEIVPTNWTLAGIACSADAGLTITGADADPAFQPGDTTVTMNVNPGDNIICTYSNTANAASVTIIKDADFESGQPFGFAGSFGGFNLIDDGPPATNATATFPVTTGFGPRAVNELVPTGWTLAGIVCSADAGLTITGADADPAFQAGDTTVTIDVNPGDTVTCTYSNTANAASVTIIKDADFESGQPFGFAGSFGGFNLVDDGPPATNATAVFPVTTAFGPRAVNELVPTGWTLAGIVCSADGGLTITGADADPAFQAGDTTVTIDVNPGDIVTCTYSNTANAASVTIIKDADFESGQPFGFAGSFGGFNLIDDGPPATNATAVFPVTTGFGPRSINELVPTGWTLAGIVCSADANLAIVGADADPAFQAGDTTVTIDVNPGDTVTCTYSNTANAASVTIIKDADFESGQPFGFAGSFGGFNLIDDGPPATNATATFPVTTGFGSRAVNELVPTGWTLAGIVCSADGGLTITGADADPAFQAGDTTVTIDVNPGDTVTCTYSNTANAASVTIIKDADFESGQPFGFAGSFGGFNLVDDGPPATNATAVFPVTTAFGPRAVNELVPTGWTLAGIVCSADGGLTITGADADPAFQAGDTTVTIDVNPGDTVTCTYSNTANAASVTIIKDADFESGQPFGFAGSFGGFNLIDDGPPATNATAVFPVTTGFGPRAVNELVPTGWTLAGIVCSADGGLTITGADADPAFQAGDTTVTIDVNPGDTVTCTYSNTANAASVTIIKDADFESGQPFGFAGSFGGFNLIDDGPPATNATAVFPVTTGFGPRSVNELVPTGWTLAGIVCSADGGLTITGADADPAFQAGDTTVTIDVNPGDTVTCTYSNTANAASVTIIKDADFESGQPFGFAGSFGGFNLVDDGPPATNATAVFPVTTGFGPRSVNELVPTGWTLAGIVCSADGGLTITGADADPAFQAGDTTVTIDVNPGDTVTCTYSNTANAASVTIIKDADFESGQPFGFAGSFGGFNLIDDGPPATNATAVFPVTTGFGPRSVNELVPTGWTLAGIVCSADGGLTITGADADPAFQAGDTTVTIDVNPGDTVTCTYTNTANAASVTIIKDADFESGQPFGFAGSFGGFNLIDDGPPATNATATFPVTTGFGPRAVNELVPTGWTLAGIVCSADGGLTITGADNDPAFQAGDTTVTIDVNPGDTVTCTYNNTANAASVTIIKDADFESSLEFGFSGSFGGFDLIDDGPPATNATAVFPVTTGFGTRTVTETIPTGWTLAGIVCSADANLVIVGADADPAFQPGDTTVMMSVDPGDTVTCTYTNTANAASVTIIKDADFESAQPFGFAGSFGGFNLIDDGPPADNATAVFPVTTAFGPRNVNELVPTGWTLAGIVCSTDAGLTITGADNDPAFQAGDTTVTIDVNPGDTVTCTYNNTANAASVTIIKDADFESGQPFGFAGSFGGFNLVDDGPPATNATATFPVTTGFGSRAVNELVPTGWTLAGIVCSADGGLTITGADADPAFQAGDTTVTIDVNPGDTVTCTYSNTANAASVTIIKDADFESGQPFGFAGSFGGFNLIDDGPPATNATATFPVTTGFGPRAVNELVPTGWTLAGIVCSADGGLTITGADADPAFQAGDTTVTIDVNPGDTVTCTYSNTANAASVTIIKDADFESGQPFGFAGSFGGFNLIDDGAPATNATAVFPVTTGFGPRSVNELVPTGWTLAGIVCSADGGLTITGADADPAFQAGDTTVTIDVNPGDTVTCTYSNTANAASVTIIKDADFESGQPFGFAGSFGGFNLIDDGPPATNATAVFPVTTGFGPRAVNELVPTGWTLAGIVCSADGGLTITGADNDPAFQAGDTTVTIDVNPGDTVTCTYNNTANAASVTIIKDADFESGQPFGFAGSFGGFNLIDDGPPATNATATFPVTTGFGPRAVNELVPTGWTLAGIVCSADGGLTITGADNDPAFQAGDTTVTIDVNPGDTVTCTYNNTANAASVTIIKDADFESSLEFGFSGSFGGFNLIDDGPPATNATATFPVTTGFGPRAVNELVPTGWTLAGIVCSADGGLTITGADNDPAFQAGDTTVTIDVNPGDTVTCTYNNTANAASVTIIKDADFESSLEFGFAGSFGGFNLSDDGMSALNMTTFPVTTGFGPRSVTELVPTGWTLAGIVCSADGGLTITGADNDPAFQAGDTTVTIDVNPGDTVTCTYNNTANAASVTIIKDADFESGQPFGFAGSFGGFNLIDDGPPATNATATFPVTTGFGPRNVNELVPTGWTLAGIVCSADGGLTITGADADPAFQAGDTTVTIDVNPGDTVTCTYNNTANAASVTIIKDADFESGQPFGFAGSFGGFNLIDDGPPATNATATFPVTTGFGPRSINELVPTGWTLAGIVCSADGGLTITGADNDPAFQAGDTTVTIDVNPGDTVTCTYTNTANAASVTIIKDADFESSLEFGFAGSFGGFNLSDDGMSALNMTTFPVTTGFGPRSVTELVPTGWTLAGIVCSADGGLTITGAEDDPAFQAGDTTVTIDVNPGDTVTCTYNNTANAASVTIIKDADFESGQPFGFAGSFGGFNLIDDGPPATNATAVFPVTSAFGPRSVNELVPTGWTLANITCDGDSFGILGADNDPAFQAGDTIVSMLVEPGDNITCTYFNTANAASVTIIKDADFESGQPFGFAGSFGGFNLVDDGAPATNATATFPVTTGFGSRAVNELVPTGWTLVGIVCSADGGLTITGADADPAFQAGDTTVTIDVNPGDIVTCTYSNTANAASVTIIKDADFESGQPFGFAGSFGGFNLIDDGPPATNATAVFPVTTAFGPRAVNELVPTGWTLAGIVCSADGGLTITGADADPAFQAGDTTVTIDVNPGDIVTCTYSNTANAASVTIIKDADFESGQPFGFAGSFGGFNLIDDGPPATNATAVFPVTTGFGSRAVNELVPTGWTLAGIVCSADGGLTITGADADPAFQAGDTTVTIDVNPGDTVTCTYSNTANAASVTIIKDADFESGQPFGFAGSFGGFNLIDDGPPATNATAVFPVTTGFGPRSVNELVPTGWTLAGIVCSADGGLTITGADADPAFQAGDTTVTIDVNPGDTVTCTYSNTANAASVTIIKDADFESGQPFGFAGSFGGFNLIDDGPPATNATAVFPVTTGFGPRSVNELVPTGWTLAGIVCSADGGLTITGADADPAFQAGDTTVTIDVNPGDTVTCTYSNTANAASVTIIKDADFESGQPFGFAGSFGGFNLIDDGPPATNATAVFPVTTGFGPRAVNELVPTGWTLAGIVCSADGGLTITGADNDPAFQAGDTTVTIDVNPGDTVTCTYNNTANAASVTIIKDADFESGQPFGFAGSFGGFNLIDDGPPATNATAVFPVTTAFGPRAVNELVPTGWTLAGIVCSADGGLTITGADADPAFQAGDTTVTIDVNPGDTVTCTYNNTANAASVTIIKDADFESGQPFGFAGSFGGFNLIDDGPPATNATATFPVTTGFGPRAVNELVPTGWTLAGIVCSADGGLTITGADNDPAFQAGDTTVTIDVNPGDTVTCTYNNTANAASVTIIKDADFESGQPFGFAGSFGGFNLIDDGPPATNATATFPVTTGFGPRDVNELVPTGWTLTGITCSADAGLLIGADGNFDAGDTTVTIDVNPGDTVTCTYNNTANAASVTIIKDADFESGLPFGFDGSFGGFNLVDDGPPATNATAVFPVITGFGPRSINEIVPTSWTLAGIACSADAGLTITGADNDPAFQTGDTTVTIDVNPGDAVTCTYHNTANAASVTIIKDADFVSAQQFGFAGSFGGFNLIDDGPPATNATAVFPVTTGFGPRSINELVPTGWTLAGIACSADGGLTITGADDDPAFQAGDTTVTIDVNPGDTVTCTYNNTANAASVTIIKDADFESAQPFGFDGSFDAFDLVDDGPPATNATATFPVTTGFGPRSINELVPTGWTLAGITCSPDAGLLIGADGHFDAGDTTVTADVNPGDTITCTYTNLRGRGTIVVEKQTDPNGSPTSFNFTASYDADGFSLVDGGENTSGALLPDTYSVAEIVPDGWTLAGPVTCSDGSPADAIVLDPNETVRCVFNNTQLANIIIKEQTIPAGLPDEFGFIADPPLDPAAFTLTDGESQSYLNLAAGDYKVAQEELFFAAQTIVQPGIFLASIDCDDANSTTSVPDRAANIVLEAGETVTCTFVNVLEAQEGTIIVRKVVDQYDTDQEFPFDASYDDDGFSLEAGEENVSEGLPAGTYSVEELVPDGWDLESAVCSDGSPAKAIVLDADETVVCTFTNEREPDYDGDTDDDFDSPFDDAGDPGTPAPTGDTAGDNGQTGQQPAPAPAPAPPPAVVPETTTRVDPDPAGPAPLNELPRTGQGLDRATVMGGLLLILGGMAVYVGARRRRANQT